MSKEPIVKNYFTFVRGLITEANALTFPENASFDEQNFVLNRDGSRRRRQGIDYEAGYTLSKNIDKDYFSERAISTHLWESVSGVGSINFQVVQIGPIVYFYDYSKSTISDNLFEMFIDLSDYKLNSVSNPGREPIQAISGNGQLFITSKEITPIYLTYNKNSDVFSAETINILYRDFEGVPDGTAIDYRPTTLTANHEYNLKNQGWSDSNITTYLTSKGVYPSNADIWHYAKDINDDFSASLLDKQNFGNTAAPKGRNILNLFDKIREAEYTFSYPNITDIKINSYTYDWKGTGALVAVMNYADVTVDVNHNLVSGDIIEISEVLGGSITYRGMVNGNATVSAASIINGKTFSAQVLTPLSFRIRFPNISATLNSNPSGGVIKAPDRTEAVVSEYAGVRPSSISFWAGRVWYGGIEYDKYNSYILFSQLVENNSNIGKCYQVADPTSEYINSLVATDGGVVPIPEMGALVKLESISDSLIVFADNGVWQIKGGESDIFKADDYYVRKVTDVGTNSPESIVQAEGSLLYWADGGIYSLSPDKVTNNLTATNITEETIQTKYNNIANASRLYTKGIYDSSQKKIYWVYNSDENYLGNTFKNKYNAVLVLDLGLQAFSIYSIKELATNSPYIVSPTISSKLIVATIALNVNEDGNQVQVSGDNVTTDVSYPASGASKIKFLTAVPQTDGINNKITFSDFNDSTFYDWRTKDGTGVDAQSYIETGFELFSEDVIRDIHVENLYTYFRKTETGFVDDGSGNVIYENPSRCTGYAKWNWSNSTNSNKETAGFECYKFDRMYIPSGTSDPFTDGTYVVDTKNNITGQGKSIRFRFESVAGNDCWLLGWTTQGGINRAP